MNERSLPQAPLSSQIGAPRAAADKLHGLARAMIRQARMLKAAGSHADARALAERARALDALGWSYVPSGMGDSRSTRASLH
jgi:hypothetical protein